MKSISGQYISTIKSFFPIMGKKERQYIKSLTEDVADYCIEEDISSLEQLYEKYGMPHEVANMYLSMLDVEVTAKRIRHSKWIKITVSVMLFLFFCGVLVWGITTYNRYRSFADVQAFSIEETIH